MKQPAIYIITNKPNGTLYIGLTSDILKRSWEHKHNMLDGFTSRYHCHLLVYYELAETMEAAIAREKQLKKWERSWKIKLIESTNPGWKNLYYSLI